MGHPEFRTHLPRGLADYLQIPADRVEQDGNRNAAIFAQTETLNEFFAAIPNVQQICSWIW